ncbi:MAG TPA: hypothetical protein VI248_11175 [Kineosporiaceae bacterium]
MNVWRPVGDVAATDGVGGVPADEPAPAVTVAVATADEPDAEAPVGPAVLV